MRYGQEMVQCLLCVMTLLAIIYGYFYWFANAVAMLDSNIMYGSNPNIVDLLRLLLNHNTETIKLKKVLMCYYQKHGIRLN